MANNIEDVMPRQHQRRNSEPLCIGQHAFKLDTDSEDIRNFDKFLKKHLDQLRVVLLNEHRQWIERDCRGKRLDGDSMYLKAVQSQSAHSHTSNLQESRSPSNHTRQASRDSPNAQSEMWNPPESRSPSKDTRCTSNSLHQATLTIPSFTQPETHDHDDSSHNRSKIHDGNFVSERSWDDSQNHLERKSAFGFRPSTSFPSRPDFRESIVGPLPSSMSAARLRLQPHDRMSHMSASTCASAATTIVNSRSQIGQAHSDASMFDRASTVSSQRSIICPLPSTTSGARSRLNPQELMNECRSNRSSMLSIATTINPSRSLNVHPHSDATMLADILSPSASFNLPSQPCNQHHHSALSSITSALDSEDRYKIERWDSAPDTFTISPFWQETPTLVTQRSEFGLVRAFDSEMELDDLPGTRDRCIFSPNSMRRLIWNLVSVACICFDTWHVPLHILGFPTTPGIDALSWFTRIFWTLDIFASFVTGYAKSDGNVVMNRRMIAWQYVKTWFPFDLAIVSCDWAEVFLSADMVLTRTIKSIRVIRLLRIFRFLRLARVTTVVETFFEMIHAEKLVILASLVKVMSLLLGLTHLLACVWFALGDASSRGWMQKELVNETDYWYHYALSFHWAICQFTGSSDVIPTSLGERVFANFALLFAFIISTWIVSSITSSMTRLHIIAGKAPAQFSALRRFLRCHGISRKLATRVQLNAHHVLELQKHRIPEQEVELLDLISEPMKKELHFEMHSPPLLNHPLFHSFSESDPYAMRKICHSAVSWVWLTAGDVVFCAGEQPLKPQMLILTRGLLHYMAAADAKAKNATKRQAQLHHDGVDVFPNEWLCEGALWTPWIFRGDLSVVEDCQFLVVDGEIFQKIAKSHGRETLRKYAVEYVEELNHLGNACTDLGRTIDANVLVQRAFPIENRHTEERRSFAIVGNISDVFHIGDKFRGSSPLGEFFKGFRHNAAPGGSSAGVQSDTGKAKDYSSMPEFAQIQPA